MKYIRCILFTLMMSLCCNMASAQLLSQETLKIARTLGLIGNYYVDSVNMKEITEKAIIGMLHDLDPHSSYIPADEAEETNEQLNGNFDGIGIQFNVLHDTIIVIETIPGGPSEKVGLKAGDRIVYIDSENVAGIKISTTDVRKRLMGPKGSKVNVRIARKDEKKLLDFTITRDKIPLESLESAYMLTKDIGYFKFNKFAATSDDEFITAINKLKSQGMKNVVVDLRNNGGGI
ncbi:MAG: PDZ domain-containing protein, partial [Bacteroidales bacterium]|nr:PDZ domain-containing protein [Bacteroidales bacterium]